MSMPREWKIERPKDAGVLPSNRTYPFLSLQSRQDRSVAYSLRRLQHSSPLFQAPPFKCHLLAEPLAACCCICPHIRQVCPPGASVPTTSHACSGRTLKDAEVFQAP